jgi:hypothetical protein
MNKQSFKQFISEIQCYESDTFSSEGSRITREESQRIAEILLYKWALHELDGVQIDCILDELRNEDQVCTACGGNDIEGCSYCDNEGR